MIHRESCLRCRGRGSMLCPDCRGTGVVPSSYWKITGKMECPTCQGECLIPCPKCKGVSMKEILVEL